MYNLAASDRYSENEWHFLLQVAGGVRVYWGRALFFYPYVLQQFLPNYWSYSNEFDTIVFLSLRRIEWCSILPPKSQFQNLTSTQLGVTGQIRPKLVILGIIRFGGTRRHFGTHFIRLSKFWAEESFPHRLIHNGPGRKLTWPEVIKIKNPKHTFCRYPLQYFILKVWIHWD